MVIRTLKIITLFSFASVTGCYNTNEAEENQEIYLQKLEEFNKTRDVQAICAAANIIGNQQDPFPMSKSERSEKFVEHILTGLREAEAQGQKQLQESCSSSLWEALRVGRPKRLKRSTAMAECLNNKATKYFISKNDFAYLYTADDYLTCAKEHNYTP